MPSLIHAIRSLIVASAIFALAPCSLCASEPIPLTRDGRIKMDPVFLRDGEEIVFTLLETPVQLSLMRLKVAEGSVERLHPKANTSEVEAAFSSDGRYCAFPQSRGNLSVKLVIRDRDAQKDSIFDPGGGFAGVHAPAISPDNRRVLFSIPASGGQQIVAVNLEGKDRKELTRSTGVNNWPDFSPDGREIVFGSSRDGDFEIYVMDADGENTRRLTHSPGRDVRPAWSPDGSRIAFTSTRDGNSEVYVMHADGSGLANVSRHPERDDYAAWHPDGRHLVVVSERKGHTDLYRVAVPE